jgi:hypothetical protein
MVLKASEDLGCAQGLQKGQVRVRVLAMARSVFLTVTL